MKVCVMGTGYVGLVSGACFADLGNEVTCVDVDEAKVASLRAGKVPFYEPGLPEIVTRNVGAGRLTFTTDAPAAIRSSRVVFICVGTPQTESGEADLRYVYSAATTIAESIDDFTVIVDKSTVPVGTAAQLTRFISRRTSVPFEVTSNPEFLREGSAVGDFRNPDRVILGTSSERARKVLEELYAPLESESCPILNMSPETAEIIKYAANAMLACRIAFVNALTGLCERVGADIGDVSHGIGLDSRIGPKFLQASPGYGGSCFPKDVRSLINILEDHQESGSFFRAIDEANESHKKSHVARIQMCLPDVDGQRVAILGLAFKPETDDIRESPTISLVRRLQRLGARIVAHDPEATENFRRLFPEIEYVCDPYEAADGAAAVVIMTEWKVYRDLDLERLKSIMERPNLIDCRNLFPPERTAGLGFNYVSVGRPPKVFNPELESNV